MLRFYSVVQCRERGWSGGVQGAAEGGSCAYAIYGHTTDSASLLAAGLMQLLVNKMAFLISPF